MLCDVVRSIGLCDVLCDVADHKLLYSSGYDGKDNPIWYSNMQLCNFN
jgi:hypothetical protein